MAVNYAYNWADIDPETNMCIGVESNTQPIPPGPTWVSIPVNDEEYVFKYYINGNWYEDEEGTIPWVSSML